MARATKTTTRTAPAPKAPRSVAKPEKAAAKPSVSKATATKVSAERAPPVSKDELRTQVEKLEQAVATLRAKGREATKAAKASAARIAELEDEVAALEKQVASQAASAKRSATKAAGRKSRDIDPGDAVPPGVAVQEPEPMDEEAEKALESPEHLGEGSEVAQDEEKEQAG